MQPDRLARRDVEVDAAQNVDRPGGGGHGQMQVSDSHERQRRISREPETAGWHPWRQHMASAPGRVGRKQRGAFRRGISRGMRCADLPYAVLLFMLAIPHALAAPVRLLVLGDSLTAGYGLPHADGFEAQLQQALRAHGFDVSIIDGAVSGDTSAGGRARLDWVLAGGADAAIVELGANDGLRGLDPSDMAANLGAILDALAAKHIPVLFSGHVRAAQSRAGL